MSERLALYHPSGGPGRTHNPFGKDVANLELFRAILRHGDFKQIDFLTVPGVSVGEVRDAIAPGVDVRATLTATNLLDQAPAIASGALLRGHPDLADLAWMRRSAGAESAYSVLGLVHTIAPPAMRQLISAAMISPVQPWDAIICTSPSVQAALGTMFAEWADYLGERYGGSKIVQPQLPLLPLGVDAPALAQLADRPAVRLAVREELGVAPEDVVVLWVGRLSFFEKAFPQPMFRAVEEAACKTGTRVHFVMVGWFPEEPRDREAYLEAAHAYAPSVEVHLVDGNDRERLGAMWAGADIFLSLVDNIQETFGITPLEAMAAGLPVVVSDWDGYRYTVSDGEAGFLIPTLGGVVGAGRGLIAQHVTGLLTYQTYVGVVAQHTAVDVAAAAERLAQLIASPSLRASMGASARARVRQYFDWPVVVRQLQGLLDELTLIRLAAQVEPSRHMYNPIKKDPYESFSGFPTEVARAQTRVSVREGSGIEDLRRTKAVWLDRFGQGWRATYDEGERALGLIAQAGGMTIGDVAAQFPAARRQAVVLTIMWLCKLGVLSWRSPVPPEGAPIASDG